MDYGIKVSQPGYDVKTASPDQLVFSSQYRTLRVKQQGSGVITHSGGRTITIPHNLGYVPYFLVHTTPDKVSGFLGDQNSYFIPPYVPFIGGACHIDREIITYADDTNLYIKLGADFGYNFAGTGIVDGDYAYQYSGSGGGWIDGNFAIGDRGNPLENVDAAIRFQGVGISQGQNVLEATIGISVTERGGGEVIKYILRGIDEDDTGNFNYPSGYPFGRPQTSAQSQADASNPSVPGIEYQGVTNIVQEIVDRGGWSSGNHMGFFFFNNNTADGSWWGNGDDNCVYCSCSFLRVLLDNVLSNYKYTIFYNKIQ